MNNPLRRLICALALLWSAAAAAGCGDQGLWLEVLGSGGPEIGDGRASASYLVWLDGRARLLIDAGGGSALNFERAGARLEDLDAILFTHFHVDHAADLPVYVKAAFFSDRDRDLPIYGPAGNRLMPDAAGFLEGLFGAGQGAFRYLSDYLDPARPEGFRLVPHSLETARHEIQPGYRSNDLTADAIPVHHGPIPALAWRVRAAGKTLVISGDMNGDFHTLPRLARDADLLVAHNAIPEGAEGVARFLHMPPSVIGQQASKAKVKSLLLSHRMRRTLGREAETERIVRRYYDGSVEFAEDGECVPF